ncbi:hypothetical protein F7725_015761 [Dissostichus mawsoni]|uniref:Uncharacterized protein n=1 Tax=Dissostichus mawsoni TaxID=36200 RepID=A0A7J5YIG7_DISMA|nr:hypothetical protein F7725_015761 [Dissostichus mawsoni]
MGFGGVGESKKREGEAGSISDLHIHTDRGGGVRREEEKQEISGNSGPLSSLLMCKGDTHCLLLDTEAFHELKWRLAMLKCLHCCACNSTTVYALCQSMYPTATLCLGMVGLVAAVVQRVLTPEAGPSMPNGHLAAAEERGSGRGVSDGFLAPSLLPAQH